VEQKVKDALELADRAYVLQTGSIVQEGTGADLLKSDDIRKAYLGM
jgi:branched-chain amino acid transport system ATP-binding protein